ncbi:methionine ABC transporter permease [Pseudonocardia oroxyli]|uniref:D-methionine transport system permease protein n=1 Tax=Pseudonocardia oroxyli TaxID=366584 RepID=A0A1G8E8C5_PSEOR|nr:methionine ABC transporter permease [Pseudonocardia oroxyli]SDH66101.1 D-methionine transport system permease protein [Pseudonocardia oroxyli]
MTDWAALAPVLWLSFQQTVYMVFWTMLIAGLLGLALGVALYTTRKGGLLANTPVFHLLNVLVNIVRPIPFIIFITAVGPLTLLVMGTTIGTQSVLFPMAAMATFVIGRVVEQNLVSVDPGVIEAARAMGASRFRIIWSVLIPEALGPLILGYTFLFVGVIDMSAMAGYVGGGGLGNFAITYGYQQFDWPVTLVTVVIIIVIVQAAQLIGNALARKVLRR